MAVSFTFYLLLFSLILEGEEEGLSFFLKKILHLKAGGGCGFIYLLFIFC